MTLEKYLEGIVSKNEVSHLAQLEISDITSDSRSVKPGCIFVCIKGGRFDGHDVAAQTLQNGAEVVVCERDLGLEKQILVENTRNAYALLCANHFGNPARKLRLIGITGTSGKTTVSYLIKSVLSAAGKKTGLIGTIQNEILDITIPAKYTTPDPYQLHSLFYRMANAGCEYVVMETSSQALDQQRLAGCHFEMGVFTNLSQDHLDYHKTIENYFAAKKKLFKHCDRAVISIDSTYGEELATEQGERAITCSIDKDAADYTAKDIKCDADGSRFVLVGKGYIERISVPMPGRFSVVNAMQAAVVALELGIPSNEVAKGLSSCYGVVGRAEVIPTGDRDFTIIRDFAHTPEELKNIVEAMREFKKGRLITLFGCAGNRDRTKRPLMAESVAEGSDLVILTSDNPRDEDPLQIINDAKPGLDKFDTPYKIIPDRYTAIYWAIDNLRSGDLLLLAGKGHEDYQVLHDETIYFDEKVFVEEILKEDRKLEDIF